MFPTYSFVTVFGDCLMRHSKCYNGKCKVVIKPVSFFNTAQQKIA